MKKRTKLVCVITNHNRKMKDESLTYGECNSKRMKKDLIQTHSIHESYQNYEQLSSHAHRE